MFIKHKSSKIINLTNVSNIGLDLHKTRVIFNFQHSIDVFRSGLCPDYIYIDCSNNKELEEFYKEIITKVRGKYFIDTKIGNRMVNIDSVCSIYMESDRNRIIFNLNHPIEGTDRKTGRTKITSNFIFWNFDSVEEYEEAVIAVNELM